MSDPVSALATPCKRFDVAGASERVQIEGARLYQIVRVWNDGPSTAFVAFGDNTITAAAPADAGAAAADILPPGGEMWVRLGVNQTHIAAIAPAGSAAIYVSGY